MYTLCKNSGQAVINDSLLGTFKTTPSFCKYTVYTLVHGEMEGSAVHYVEERGRPVVKQRGDALTLGTTHCQRCNPPP